MNHNLQVLTVEDCKTTRKIIKRTLRQIGFTKISEADDGTTALEVLKNEKIDLIFSDWSMANIWGLDLLKAVRGDESTKNIPFVMISIEAEKDRGIQAIQAGATGYLVKPFTGIEIKKQLEKIFDK